jgi:hypothetical protein
MCSDRLKGARSLRCGAGSCRVTGAARSRLGFLPALPALILLFVFFLFPVVRMLGFSVEGGTLDWYAKALGEQLYLRVFWNTFEIALLVTVFCLLLGYPLAFLIATTHALAGRPSASLRAAAALDLGAGAHLRLDGAARPQRRVQPHAHGSGRHRAIRSHSCTISPAC